MSSDEPTGARENQIPITELLDTGEDFEDIDPSDLTLVEETLREITAGNREEINDLRNDLTEIIEVMLPLLKRMETLADDSDSTALEDNDDDPQPRGYY